MHYAVQRYQNFFEASPDYLQKKQDETFLVSLAERAAAILAIEKDSNLPSGSQGRRGIGGLHKAHGGAWEPARWPPGRRGIGGPHMAHGRGL